MIELPTLQRPALPTELQLPRALALALAQHRGFGTRVEEAVLQPRHQPLHMEQKRGTGPTGRAPEPHHTFNIYKEDLSIILNKSEMGCMI